MLGTLRFLLSLFFEMGGWRASKNRIKMQFRRSIVCGYYSNGTYFIGAIHLARQYPKQTQKEASNIKDIAWVCDDEQ